MRAREAKKKWVQNLVGAAVSNVGKISFSKRNVSKMFVTKIFFSIFAPAGKLGPP